MKLLNFYLFHNSFAEQYWVKIQDPVGWNSLGKTINRRMKWHGIFYEYTPKLKFVQDGRLLIQRVYETFGVQAEILLRIDVWDEITRKYVRDFTGRLNLLTYSIDKDFAEVSIETAGILKTLDNRDETKVNLEASVTQNGSALPALSNTTVTLHSKTIKKNVRAERDVAAGSFGENYTSGTTGVKYYIPELAANQLNEDAGEFYSYEDQVVTADPIADRKYFLKLNNSSNGTWAFNNRMRVKITGLVSIFDDFLVEVVIARRKGDTGVVSQSVTTVINETSPANVYDSGWIDLTILSPSFNPSYSDCSLGDEFYFFFKITYDMSGFGPGRALYLDFDDTIDQRLFMQADTSFPATEATGTLIFETWQRVLRSIADKPNDAIFFSSYYGRTENGYAADGAGSLRLMLTGNKIRGLDSKGVTLSLKQLMDFAMAVDGAGIGLERVGTTERVRVEPLTHWYRAQKMMRLTFVKDLQKEVIPELIYSQVKIGYDNKALNEQTNNLDEFNVFREYTTPISVVKNPLSLMTDIVTSGYTIEYLRRNREAQTRDTERDDDVICVQLRRDGLNLVTDKNEDFTVLTLILDAPTVYNAKLSPARCLKRNGRLIGAGLQKNRTESLRFNFAPANSEMQSRLTGESVNTIENASPVISTLDKPLFVAEKYTFKAVLTREQWKYLNTTDPDAPNNVWQYIEFSDTDQNFTKGYLMKATPRPDSLEGEFELIRANI
ncbi:MAG: hypothetical protein ACK5WO_16660 [Cyclobacteriaceae bacterium]|jgi:hypothetical protein